MPAPMPGMKKPNPLKYGVGSTKKKKKKKRHKGVVQKSREESWLMQGFFFGMSCWVLSYCKLVSD